MYARLQGRHRDASRTGGPAQRPPAVPLPSFVSGLPTAHSVPASMRSRLRSRGARGTLREGELVGCPGHTPWLLSAPCRQHLGEEGVGSTPQTSRTQTPLTSQRWTSDPGRRGRMEHPTGHGRKTSDMREHTGVRWGPTTTSCVPLKITAERSIPVTAGRVRRPCTTGWAGPGSGHPPRL